MQPTSKTYAVKVDGQTPNSWAEVITYFDDANVYQTWAYGSVRWGSQNLSHLVLLRDGSPIAATQIRIIKSPVIPMGIAYVRWGPMWQLKTRVLDSDSVASMMIELSREYVERRGYCLRIIPHAFAATERASILEPALAQAGLACESSYKRHRTIVVDLNRTPEEIRKKLDKKWRNQLNGAEKNGLTFEISDSLNAYDEFLRLYDGMVARKQFESSVDVRQFRQMQAALPPDQKMQIFSAKKDGVVVATLVCSLLGSSAIYLLGATDEKARELKAAYYLHWQSMLWMKSRGVIWYDLGGIDPLSNPGGYHFKQGFGGADVTQLALHSRADALLGRIAAMLSRRFQRN
jgi:hypothetical protein